MSRSTASASRPCSARRSSARCASPWPSSTESIFLDGEVRWANEYTGALEAKPREIGIFIHKPPADYLRLVAECSDRGQSRPAYQPLK